MNPPVKYKCTNCGHEEWKKIYECCCYDYCTCSSPSCSVCNSLTVPKKNWKEEIIRNIKGDLAQIYEWDKNFNPIKSGNNKWLDDACKLLELLSKN